MALEVLYCFVYRRAGKTCTNARASWLHADCSRCVSSSSSSSCLFRSCNVVGGCHGVNGVIASIICLIIVVHYRRLTCANHHNHPALAPAPISGSSPSRVRARVRAAQRAADKATPAPLAPVRSSSASPLATLDLSHARAPTHCRRVLF